MKFLYIRNTPIVLFLLAAAVILALVPVVDVYHHYRAAAAPGLQPPSNFRATVINNNRIDLTWTKAATANYTLIRAMLGREPTTIYEGWEVYYGEGESYSDNAVSVDETLVPI